MLSFLLALSTSAFADPGPSNASGIGTSVMYVNDITTAEEETKVAALTYGSSLKNGDGTKTVTVTRETDIGRLSYALYADANGWGVTVAEVAMSAYFYDANYDSHPVLYTISPVSSADAGSNETFELDQEWIWTDDMLEKGIYINITITVIDTRGKISTKNTAFRTSEFTSTWQEEFLR